MGTHDTIFLNNSTKVALLVIHILTSSYIYNTYDIIFRVFVNFWVCSPI